MKTVEYIEATARQNGAGHYAGKTENEYGDPMFVFYSVDEDGEAWPLGSATINRDGEEFAGYFDTREVSFANVQQLQAWGKRHGYAIETVD